MLKHPVIALVLLCMGSSLAWAQSGTSSTQTLLSGDVDNGFLIAPEVKLTDLNGDFGLLGGAYGGWVIDRRFLIGGGVYTLVNGVGDSDMTYGGGVFEYFVNPDSVVNFSARGLIGGGNAALDRRFPGLDPNVEWGRGFPFGAAAFPIPNEIDHFFPQLRRGRGDIDYANLYDGARRRFDEQDFDRLFGSRSSSFFIAEPEVDVNVNISEMFRLSFGGGYRFIGGAGALSDRLEGFTANVALKISFF